jgi:hypothetical protein
MPNSDEKSSEFSTVPFAIAGRTVHCADVRVVSVIKQGGREEQRGIDRPSGESRGI